MGLELQRTGSTMERIQRRELQSRYSCFLVVVTRKSPVGSKPMIIVMAYGYARSTEKLEPGLTISGLDL